jgi:hypothetical protein
MKTKKMKTNSKKEKKWKTLSKNKIKWKTSSKKMEDEKHKKDKVKYGGSTLPKNVKMRAKALGQI